jgi:type II secretory ATPase GspE/PulE/Tfp pilus assembly ATPase PilB-like protein
MEDLLIKELHLPPQDIGRSLEKYYQIPFVAFDNSLELPDPTQLKVNKETLIKQYWVPIKIGDTELIILINDPKNTEMIQVIEKHFEQLRVDYRLGLKVDIHKFINALYSTKRKINIIDVKNKNTDPSAYKDPNKENTVLIQEQSSASQSQIEGDNIDMVTQTETKVGQPQTSMPAQTSVISDESVIKLFDEIIKIASEHDVTDVHIEPDAKESNIQVRLRKDGACRVFEKIPGKHQSQLIQHIKSISKLDINQTQLPQNGSLIWEKGAIKLELKVITLPMFGDAEDVTIKIKPLSKPVPQYIPLDKMNFSEPNLKLIQSKLQKKSGLILVVSTKGNGKTTALHSLLGSLNNADKKIVTAEDPVEIVQAGLRQIQINDASGLTMALALGNIALSTPDIIMAGNLPNAESFKIALEAAKEHLVFAAITVDSITKPFEIMRGMDIDQMAVSKSLLMIINQQLVTTLCEHCKENYHPTKEEFNSLASFYGEKYFPELGVEYKEDLQIKKPVGCKKCLYSGYGKKTGINEIMDITVELKKLIAAKASLEEIKKQAVKDGLIALNQDAVYKIFKGDCDPKQVEIAFLPKED